ncbi:hypothetical protein RclHR1_04980022 [Rhizophagus clarus]|uniref:Uncharacterized protein n=1 Tax=Rhizophagus clarus TaxID=94130 RepID=A0A2Z6SD78_9GLOM|nr:hypothetical protein RclHR1_04980022 [Rhizophagus clarus]
MTKISLKYILRRLEVVLSWILLQWILRDGVPGSPAKEIEKLINGIKKLESVERKCIYFQYNDSKVIPESYDSWTDFRELFGHLKTLFSLEGSMMNYEFAICNKKVDLISKKNFIELVEQNRISFENPVKILDLKGYGSYAEIIDNLPTPSKLAEPNEWHKHNSNKPPTATNPVPVSLYCSAFGMFEDLCKESLKREDNLSRDGEILP